MNSHSPAPRRLVALAALSLALLMPASAVAQSSVDGYAPDDGTVQNQIDSGGTGNSPEASTPSARPSSGRESASLPFTGLDLAMLAGAGVLLIGLGAGMRLILRLPPAVR